MSQPTPAAPAAAQPRRVSFARWVRAVSEQQLLLAAQRRVALRYGVPLPPQPRGLDAFWQRAYVPVFYRLPYRARARVANLMPGSHRQTWHATRRPHGPAV